MATAAKIVFIGAGSISFGLSLFRDLFATTQLSGSTLTLVDQDPDALDRMTRLAQLLNQTSDAGLMIESTIDRRAAPVPRRLSSATSKVLSMVPRFAYVPSVCSGLLPSAAKPIVVRSSGSANGLRACRLTSSRRTNVIAC
jgi:hypothetical protein